MLHARCPQSNRSGCCSVQALMSACLDFAESDYIHCFTTTTGMLLLVSVCLAFIIATIIYMPVFGAEGRALLASLTISTKRYVKNKLADSMMFMPLHVSKRDLYEVINSTNKTRRRRDNREHVEPACWRSNFLDLSFFTSTPFFFLVLTKIIATIVLTKGQATISWGLCSVKQLVNGFCTFQVVLLCLCLVTQPGLAHLF